MKIGIFLILLLPTIAYCQFSQDDRAEIKKVMADQQDAWNQGELELFMEGYWKSDSLRFTSSGRTSMGWEATLDGYKKAYSSIEKMGKLKFEIFDIYPVTDGSAALVGSFYLTRNEGDLSGFFTLVWKKVDGRWKIISDMTCSN